MNSEDLRSLQAPLKDKYRSTPDKALITLQAEGQIGEGLLAVWTQERHWLRQGFILQRVAQDFKHVQAICFFKPWLPVLG